jgi:hypothetical protein
MLFFDLSGYGKTLRAGMTAEDLELRRELALHPLTLTWGKEFAGEESSPAGHWRWCCAPCGEVYLTNEASRLREVAIHLSFAVAASPAAGLYIDSPLGRQELRMDSASGQQQVLRLTLPPGKHCIRFTCNAPGQHFANDPRELYFRVIDYAVKDATKQ